MHTHLLYKYTHCEDERDQALSDCYQQSLETFRLDEEISVILEQMIHYRQCVEIKISRELMTTKENDILLKVDMKIDSSR